MKQRGCCKHGVPNELECHECEDEYERLRAQRMASLAAKEIADAMAKKHSAEKEQS